MFSTTYSAGEVLLEKRRGTWGRLMSSPIKKYEIISGYLTGIILEGFIQIGLLISLSIILFKTSWGNSFLGLAIVVLALMFAMTGIGLMLTGSVKTYGQLQAIGPLVIFPTSMLSGIFWPVEIMPSYLQNIAAIMPQYWAIDGMKKLLLSNFSFNMLIKPVSILVIIGLITMGAGMRALK
jgi:ABC-2 type transporter.